MKKDKKALEALDAEFNLFMHTQVPEQEPEDIELMKGVYEVQEEIAKEQFNNFVKSGMDRDLYIKPPKDDIEKLVDSVGMGLYGADLLPTFSFPKGMFKSALDAPVDEYGNQLENKIAFREPTQSAYDGSTISRLDIHHDAFRLVSDGVLINRFAIDPEDNKLRKYPLTMDEVYQRPQLLCGQDILTIRTLTGKARNNAIAALYEQTVEYFNQASKDCFYIAGNVPSSKNSKDIVTVKNINKKTGKPQEFSTPVDGELVRKYKIATKGDWWQNKVAFLNQTRHAKLPLRVEFTFIRKSLHAFDFINAAQIIQDLMKKYGYITDDETSYILPSFGPVLYHNKLMGVLIKVIK